MDKFEDLVSVLKKVFPSHDVFTLEVIRDEILEWDSIGHLTLIVEIEDKFHVRFTKEEIQNLDTILKIYQKIYKI